jgi:hypothetical protein
MTEIKARVGGDLPQTLEPAAEVKAAMSGF